MTVDFTEYLTERAAEFTGREWVIGAVATWRADPAGERCFLITGEPGAGKTAVAARLAAGMEAVHFCSARDRRWVNPRTFAESLSQQLAAARPAFAAALARQAAPGVTVQQSVAGDNTGHLVGVETVVVGGTAEDAFDRLVREPLDEIAEPVVVLVDALDESLGYSGPVTIADLVAQAEHLPSAVRFVLTCRPLPELLRSLRRAGARECVLTPRDGAGRDLALHDVERYVARLAPTVELAPELSAAEFVAAVRDRSAGNFLFTRHLLYSLGGRPGPVTRDAIAALPRGLDEIYLDFLQRLPRYREIAPILAVLAAVQQPVGEDLVAWVTGQPPVTVRAGLADLRQFLDADDAAPAGTRTYALYHASFGELLLDRDRAEEYWVDGPATHHTVAAAYLAAHRGGDWSDCDDYGLASLATHLYEAGDIAELQALPGAAWIAERRARRNGGYDGVLTDLDLARRAAEDADRTALAASRPAPYLADELRWALAVASIGTRPLPVALLVELALTGVWTPEQTLSYARRSRAAPDRAETPGELAEIAKVLPEPLRSEARREAVTLAERLPGASRESAAERRVAALTGLMPLLPADLRRRAAAAALANARRLADRRRVAGGNVGYYGSEFGERFQHTGLRTAALDRIADAVRPDGLSGDVPATLRSICETPDDAFAAAATEFVNRLADLPPPRGRSAAGLDVDDVQRRLAEAVAQPTGDDEQREATVAALTAATPATASGLGPAAGSAAPEPTVADAVARLDELIRAAPSPYGGDYADRLAAVYQASVLADLAGRLPDDALVSALDFAERLADPAAEDRAVRALAPHLSEPVLRSVVTRVGAGRAGAAILAPLAGLLPPPLLLDALVAARSITNDGDRAAALGALLPHLPPAEAGPVAAALAEWLVAADAAGPAGRTAIAAVARYLPAPLAGRAFAAVRDAATPPGPYATPDADAATAVLALAGRLTGPDRGEALRVAQTNADHGTWHSLQTYGAPQAPLLRALDLVSAIPPAPERDRLLATLAGRAIDEARTAQYGRGYPTWNLPRRISLLTLVLPHLPEPHLGEAAENLVRMLVDESTVPLPAVGTAALAAHLPERFLPVAEQALTDAPLPGFLPETALPAALELARQRGNLDWLFAVAERGLFTESLTVAGELGGPRLRIDLITRHAHRLATVPRAQLHEVWTATLHDLSALDRPSFLTYLRDLGPLVAALGADPTAVAAAIEAVAATWP